MNIPELLAPAGSYEAFVAAIESGADAVYLGGQQFNARQYAANFTEDQVKKALDYAHVRERRVYMTLNVLLYDQEFEQALEYAFRMQQAGVDAFIIQDVGFMRTLCQVLPEARLHASTQMTIHNAGGVRMAAEIGASRVVLARELTGDEVADIHEKCPETELEFFVHGALCYSYSGQCLLSSVVGGRSGNRGRCAQPCRLAYRLNARNRKDEAGHLLSPADLCLLDKIPEMARAGIAALKIEGRMKRPEYVAVVTGVYRKALDRYRENPTNWQALEKERKDLAAVFNRTFTVNQWDGKNLKVLSPQRPNNRGVQVGRVVSARENGETVIKLTDDLAVGDGIEIWVSRGSSPASTISKIMVEGKPVSMAKAGQTATVFMPAQSRPGDRVFKTFDIRLMEAAQETIKENGEKACIPVKAFVQVRLHQPLYIKLTDSQGNEGEAWSRSPAVRARTSPLTEADIMDKVGRTGNTPLRIEKWDIELEPGTMVPFSELNETRRQAVECFIRARLARFKPPAIPESAFTERMQKALSGPVHRERIQPPALAVRVAEPAAVRAAWRGGADRVYLSLHGLAGIPTLEEIRELVDEARRIERQLFLQVPAIIKPGDAWNWTAIKNLKPDGIMIGDLGGLAGALRLGLPIHVDYTMNIFNKATLGFLAEQGVKSVCVSPELNRDRLHDLLPAVLPVEYIVHGLQPLMVSEHCIFGNLTERCGGHGCQQARGVLIDERGFSFPVVSDRFCRLHLFNSRTTCLIEEVPEMVRAGLSLIRIEVVLDDPDRIEKVTAIYRQAVDECGNRNKKSAEEWKEKLAGLARSELTKLHYYRGAV